MSTWRRAGIAAMALLLFSTEAPAPDTQAPAASRMLEDRERTPARVPGSPTLELAEAQTKAIDALNDKLITIEKRVTALEKEKKNG
jgi:hypothetical protein